jgi:hypothetical protein
MGSQDCPAFPGTFSYRPRPGGPIARLGPRPGPRRIGASSRPVDRKKKRRRVRGASRPAPGVWTRALTETVSLPAAGQPPTPGPTGQLFLNVFPSVSMASTSICPGLSGL